MSICDPIAVLDRDLDVALDQEWVGTPQQGPVLSAAVAGIAEAEAKLAALKAKVTGAWVVSQDWQETTSSPKKWLKANTGMRGSTAARQVRWARKLDAMPLTAKMLAEGRIGADQVARLIRAASGRTAEFFLDDESMLVGWADEMEYTDFDKAVTYWEHAVDPDGAEQDAVDEDGGDWWASTGLGGRTEAGGTLPPLGGKEYRDELDRLERMEFDDDWAEARERLGDKATVADLRRTAGQRRAAAQVHMARRSANWKERKAPAARRVINVVMDHRTAAAQTALLWGVDPREVTFPHEGRLCELDDGTILTPGQAMDPRAVADLWFRRLVHSPPSRKVDLGRDARFFTGDARMAVELRDRMCAGIGCDLPAAKCQIDHVKEHVEGGPTDAENGEPRCGADNLHKENLRQKRKRRRRDDDGSGGDDDADPGDDQRGPLSAA